MYEYNAVVTRVVDGDTLQVDIDLGLGIVRTERIRLAGVDTPETWRPKTRAEQTHGRSATEFVSKCVEGKQVIIKTIKDRKGRYGRYLGHIRYTCWLDGIERDLATEIKKAGLTKRSHYAD